MSRLFIRLQVVEAEEATPEAVAVGTVMDDHLVDIGDADDRKATLEAGKLFESAKRLIEG